jgi:hypothetical protein
MVYCCVSLSWLQLGKKTCFYYDRFKALSASLKHVKFTFVDATLDQLQPQYLVWTTQGQIFDACRSSVTSVSALKSLKVVLNTNIF